MVWWHSPLKQCTGLGANALNPSAVRKIFLAKGRPVDNPLTVHIQHIDDLKTFARNVSRKANKLASEFWPGPLTLVLEKSTKIPQITTGSLDTIAVRIPGDILSLSLIRVGRNSCRQSPSWANVSGRPSPTRASHVLEDLNGKVDLIIDCGKTRIGLESTVIDMTSAVPVLLRPGGLPLERIREVIVKFQYIPRYLIQKKRSLEK